MASAELVLFEYFRSSASYRVRIALNLKKLTYARRSVHLTRDGGQQFTDAFRGENPQLLVPVLRHGAVSVTQSLAIMEYLEERFPEPALLPASPGDRAFVRQLALAVACDVHPLNNLRVLKYLEGELGVAEAGRRKWVQHWIALGFTALERWIADASGRGGFCFGNAPTMADCCLVPQLFNARRFDVDLSPYPTLRDIEARCLALDAFAQAHPARQPDADQP